MAVNHAYSVGMSGMNALPGRQGAGLERLASSPTTETERVREAFTQFVGETFYLQMLKAMRTSLGEPAYFHGGRAEEVFTSQLDQTLAEELADKSTERFVEPLFQKQFPHLSNQPGSEYDVDDRGGIPLQRLRRG